jgi:hypothetical protein
MIRNAGILRKLPDDDDLHLTIDGSVLKVLGDDIPRVLSGYPMGVFNQGKRVGEVSRRNRRGFPDLIEIRVFNLVYNVPLWKFRNVWSGKFPYCNISERVHDCWKDFEVVRV